MRQMLLHIEAFEHRCLSTQKHLPREALTYTRLCTQKLLDTDGFSENHRSFDTEKPLHTHRSFYTQAFPQKLLHREAFEHELLHTDVFTNRRLVHTGLLRTEAFTQRSLYTQTLSHRKPFHRAAFTHFKKSQFYVFDVWPSYRAKGLHPALENRNSWRWTIILREMGCAWPCKIAFLHQFYFAWNSCAWRSKMDKVAILHQFLNVCIWR